MTPPCLISVVIPTFQRRASVERGLRALCRQRNFPAEDFAVVVSVDGSTDGTSEMLARFDAEYALRSVWRPNQGRARACNAGIREARGELIVLLDDDMEAAPGLLAAHWNAHRDSPRRAVIGAAPMTLPEGSAPLHRYIGSAFNRRLEALARAESITRFRDVCTGNFSVRRALFLEVGGFDDAFRVYGHEDYELAWRLLAAGVEIRYCREALARQHYDKDFRAVAQDSVGRGRNDVLFAAKHPQAVTGLRLGRPRQAGRAWRLLRAALLQMSRLFPGTPDRVIRCVSWVEGRQPARLDRCYELALDYFYWLGARAAQRERRQLADAIPGRAPAARAAEP